MRLSVGRRDRAAGRTTPSPTSGCRHTPDTAGRSRRCDPIQHHLGVRAPVAAQTAGLAGGSVDLHHVHRIAPGAPMELIDVLDDDGVELGAPLDVDDRVMTDVGSASAQTSPASRRVQFARRTSGSHMETGARRLLCRRILGPGAVRAAKIREARISRDACAARHHHRVGVVDEGPCPVHERARLRHGG